MGGCAPGAPPLDPPMPRPRHTSGQSVCFPGGKFTHPHPDTHHAPTLKAAIRFASPAGSSLIPARTLTSSPQYKRPFGLLPRREVHSSPPGHSPCPRHTSGHSVCFPGGKFTHPHPDTRRAPALKAAIRFASPAGSSLIPTRTLAVPPP